MVREKDLFFESFNVGILSTFLTRLDTANETYAGRWLE